MPTTRIVGYPARGTVSSGTVGSLRMTYVSGSIDLLIAKKFTTSDYIMNWTLVNNDQREGPVWAASTVMSVGDIRVNPSTVATKYWIVDSVTSDNLTGASQPAWDTTVGNTTVDNHVTWRCKQSTWLAAQTTPVGTIVLPTVTNGFYYVCTTNTGDFKTGGSQPTWGTTVNGTTTDNHVTWTCYSALTQITSVYVPSRLSEAVYFEGTLAYNSGAGVYWRTGHRYTPYRHNGITGGIIGANTIACYTTEITLGTALNTADGVWAANTAYPAGSRKTPVLATSYTGFSYVSSGGTSHSTTEPTWPTTFGGTVVDNTITWTAVQWNNTEDLVLFWYYTTTDNLFWSYNDYIYNTPAISIWAMLPNQSLWLTAHIASSNFIAVISQQAICSLENFTYVYGANGWNIFPLSQTPGFVINRVCTSASYAITLGISTAGPVKIYNSRGLWSFTQYGRNVCIHNCAFEQMGYNQVSDIMYYGALPTPFFNSRNCLSLGNSTTVAPANSVYGDVDYVVNQGVSFYAQKSLVQVSRRVNQLITDLKLAYASGGKTTMDSFRFMRGQGSILEATGCPLVHNAGFSDQDIDGQTRPDITLSTAQAITAGDRTNTLVRLTCNNHGLVTNDKVFISGMPGYGGPSYTAAICRSGDAVIRSASHGFSDGDAVAVSVALNFINGYPSLYYVRDSTSGTFKVSTSSGGTALTCSTSNWLEFASAAYMDTSANTFAVRNSGLANGMVVRSRTTASGLTKDTDYFVRDFSAPTFALETSPGSGAIDLTGSSALCWWGHVPYVLSNFGILRTGGGWFYLNEKLFTVTRIDNNIIELQGILSSNFVSDYATETPGGYIQKYTGTQPCIGPSEGITLLSYVSGTGCLTSQ